MKQLKDLKEDILNGIINNFYIFTGQDFGIKHHYIYKIKEQFDEIIPIMDIDDLMQSRTGSGLWKVRKLYIATNDTNLLNTYNKDKVQTLINRMNDDCLVCIYDTLPTNSVLLKEFDDYVTDFPAVSDKIAMQFVDMECSLSSANKKELIFNCHNDYNTILLECDKIRSYSDSKQITNDAAYDELRVQGQLLYRPEEFNIGYFMDDVLTKHAINYSYWCDLIHTYYSDQFWLCLGHIFNDFLTAYYIKQYGRWDGSNRAYSAKLPWNRTKEIRDLNIRLEAKELLECANKIADVDILVKTGKLDQEKLLDHFMCTILNI